MGSAVSATNRIIADLERCVPLMATTQLDPIETRLAGFELVHKTCAAVLVGSLAWFVFNLHTVVPHLLSGSEGDAALARLSLVGFLLVGTVFALPLALLNSRRSWLLALAGMPFLALSALTLATSVRPLAYRLMHWDHPVGILLNVVLILGLVVFVTWVVLFVRGWLGASTLIAMPACAAYLGKHLRTSRGRILEFMLAVPPVVAVMQRRKLRTRLLFLVHAVSAGLAAFLPFAVAIGIISFPSAEQQLHHNPTVRASGLGPGDAARLLWAVVLTTGAAFLVVPITFLIARRSLGWAQSNIRVSMQELLATDQRRPILFLRSFRDDQVRLPRSRWSLLRLLTGSSDRRLLDHLATEELSSLGPVVALGAPGEPMSPYGAARGYFEHANWQHAVLTLMDRAALIVLVVDDTAGTWWEIEQIAARREWLHKTIFLVHPEHAANGKSQELLQRIVRLLGSGAATGDATASPAEPARRVLGLYVNSGGTVWLQSSSFSERAYSLALRKHSADVVAGASAHGYAIAGDPATPVVLHAPRRWSWQVATLVALGLSVVSTVLVMALHHTSLPAKVLGVSIRPWLASAVVLVPLLLLSGVRHMIALPMLVGTWVFAGWLSGSLYHLILQIDQVTWDTFDHHAELAAHGVMFLVMGAAMIYLFGLSAGRVIRLAAILALAGSATRWAINTLCLTYLPMSALESPMLAQAQHVLITWPGLIFIAISLAQSATATKPEEARA